MGFIFWSAMAVDARVFIHLGFGMPDIWPHNQRPFMTCFVCLFAMLVISLALVKAGEKIDQTEVSIGEFAQFIAATG